MSDMGTSDMGALSKPVDGGIPPATNVMPYPPEWAAAAFQAYYSSGMTQMPPPNPYMWGAQHLMPPYGTPPPFASIYSHGGMYAHPGAHPYSPYTLAGGHASEAQGANVSVGADAEGKQTDGKLMRSPLKRFKGSQLARHNSKDEDAQKGMSRSMNGFGSYSADSASEGSTEGSEENSQDGVTDQVLSEATNPVGGTTLPSGCPHEGNNFPGNNFQLTRPVSMGGKQSSGGGAGAYLNGGMMHWSGSTGVFHPPGHGKRSESTAVTTALAPSTNMLSHGQDRGSGELCMQDERELKRQRRKQSNRESARRSRLRKQAECEELTARVETLSKENSSLRFKLDQVTEECKKLSAENCSLRERLQLLRLPDGTNGALEKSTTKVSVPESIDDDGEQLHSESLPREVNEMNESYNPAGSSGVDYGVNLKALAAIFPRSSGC